jgi:sialate O-acetylesterase
MAIEGSTVKLRFDYANGLAAAKNEALKGFMIAGADRKFVPATAVIENDSVVVSSDQVAEPRAVRYGWADVVQCNLVNASGLPASPFRTDDWAN